MSDPANDIPPVPPSQFLAEAEWSRLLRAINQRNVIPIVGPELVTVPDASGAPIPLTHWLVPRLAQKLNLAHSEQFDSLNKVACEFILNEGDTGEIYHAVREVLDDLKPVPPPALLALASIRDFDLFVTVTCDNLMAQALRPRWPGCPPERGAPHPRSIGYHPSKKNDLPKDWADGREPWLYHILGNYNTYPDFAVWEEDYIEYICGLQEQTDTLENLFRELKTRWLLLLGAPYSDWIVRFFLRVAKQKRLSSTRAAKQRNDYLADTKANLSDAMLFFVDKVVGATRIVPGAPAAFVEELVRRWRAAYGLRATLPQDTPRGAVFVSYAHEDADAAFALAESLAAAGVPVWLDKERLELGDNFHRSMEHAVKDSCSFFLSLISRTTESNSAGYYHRERAWAAQRAVDGYLFYLPVILDDLPPGTAKLEPPPFDASQCAVLPHGRATPEFIARMSRIMQEFHTNGRVRA
jgi:hypothetical protein